MTANQIRNKFIEYFTDRHHKQIPPAPIVPPDDPTTLFTSSGMQQLVPFLKGEPHPMGKRLVDSQPCFRAEDIEEVGDNRHTTFFEMLGNWSLGDYFKNQQLPWFYEFLTEIVGLDPSRLYATVFEGNSQVPKDEESITIWQEIFRTSQSAKKGNQGFDPHTKIYTYGAKENWWSRTGVPENMPAGEIGGPDSEVFFDFGAQRKIHEMSPYKNSSCHLNCECGRFLEIGNSVFIQYEKKEDKSFKPLPKKNVDFGGGLERLTAASQNTLDIFQSELFVPVIREIETLTGQKYESKNQVPMRMIADHLRAATFMIDYGIQPSNKSHGYILRRLLRKSASKIQKLGTINSAEEAVKRICAKVIETYSQSYLKDTKDSGISKIVVDEIDSFIKVLSRSSQLFNKLVDRGHAYDAEMAFNFLQTYGLPLEITEEFAELKGKKLTQPDRLEFEKKVKDHQEKSRTASAGMFKGGLADKSTESIKLHTATHLIHKALREVLGDHVHQQGSHITSERLRFDFSHPKALSDAEIRKLENLINQKIKEDLPVHKTIEDKETALKSGALAFFKETYPDKVSVYTIGKDPKTDWFSKELCGGPHVRSAGEIGNLRIIKQQAIGSGIRRIYAILTPPR